MHRQPQSALPLHHQGPRRGGDEPVTTPQRSARLLLTHPENLRDRGLGEQRYSGWR